MAEKKAARKLKTTQEQGVTRTIDLESLHKEAPQMTTLP